MKSINQHTDMAVELLSGENTGCVIDTETLGNGITRTDVTIRTSGASRRLGKPRGFYSTIETSGAFRKDMQKQMTAAETLGKVIAGLLSETVRKKKYTALVAGLGNSSMAADALGPRVCKKLMVSKTLCAISPGVYGVTGIETYDIIAGLTDKINPDIVIAVDSLSSRTVSRLASAFQVTDSGIAPGSGINNHRFRLDKKTLGIPVIAVGVPLVVYASVIASDVLNALDKEFDETHVDNVINDVLGDMVVTPKDIDAVCDDCAHILALAVNSAVHGISVEKVAMLANQ